MQKFQVRTLINIFISTGEFCGEITKFVDTFQVKLAIASKVISPDMKGPDLHSAVPLNKKNNSYLVSLSPAAEAASLARFCWISGDSILSSAAVWTEAGTVMCWYPGRGLLAYYT